MDKKNITKLWEYFLPKFEFTTELPLTSSAWSGHYFFAYDLVRNTKPQVIVELGTHKGNSLFSFAQAIKDGNLKTVLYGIDIWERDPQAGFYGNEVYEKFKKITKRYYKSVNIIPHKMLFDQAVRKFENNSIDILHIDGLHTYEAVKHDFETWLPKVNKNTGIVIFHDVCETKHDFGVYKLWEKLSKLYTTLTFNHSHGLGVLFLNKNTFENLKIFFNIWPLYYSNLFKIQSLEKEIVDKKNHIINLDSQIFNDLQIIEQMQNKNIEQTEIVEEFERYNKSKIGKTFAIYSKFVKYLKNFFINIIKDGPVITFKRIFKRLKHVIHYRKQLTKELNPYKYWLKNNRITFTKRLLLKKELKHLKYQPLISIIMPVYNVDLKWIKKAVKSINNQIYRNWELCIADDASTNPQLIKYLKKISKKKNIKVTFRKRNGHISEASNTALKLAKGEFIALMDNDDIIHPHALVEVIKVLNKDKNTDLIYSDEDKIDIKDKRMEPFFKPDWSPDLFMSTNYLCHLTVIRKKLVDSVKGFRKGFEGSQDYDLFLRIIEKTENIKHIPDILYSWRKIPGSTAYEYKEKNYADSTSIKALDDYLKRNNIEGEVTTGLFPGSFRVKYKIIGEPLVSILIPTKDKPEYIKRCISSLLQKTTYQNYEIIIIDTNSTNKETLEYYESIRDNPKIRILKWEKKFNYSAVNNYGVNNANGEYVLLLNNDTEIITPNWIEGMLEHAQREKSGAVGVKLLYPDDTIQHAGIILGINGGTGKGIAGHAFKFMPREIQGFPVQKDIIRNYSAVTAACVMIKKEKYLEMKGMDEKFRVAFNDVDFGIRLYKAGYYNLYTPYVELYHHESISVGRPEENTRDIKEFSKEIDLMYKEWEEILGNDPFFNINLDKTSESFLIET